MKRFWKDVTVEAVEGGWGIALDGKPLRTPARALLKLPAIAMAQAVAAEWGAAGETVDPQAMPLTGLANAAIDRVQADPAGFATGLVRYAEADLACYRAEGPGALVSRQEEKWDALLGWARRRFDVDFATTTGITHVAQPQATIERLAHQVSTLDAFQLAALAPLVTISGSLVATLAVAEKAMTPDEAWEAVTIDDQWQREKWGTDAEAEAALEGRRRDFMAAARFLDLLDA